MNAVFRFPNYLLNRNVTLSDLGAVHADDFPLVALDHPNYGPRVEDLRTHRLLNPIWLHPADGSILDGRNRYQMCQGARVPGS